MLTLALTFAGGAAISMLDEMVFSNIFQTVLARFINFVGLGRGVYVVLSNRVSREISLRRGIDSGRWAVRLAVI